MVLGNSRWPKVNFYGNNPSLLTNRLTLNRFYTTDPKFLQLGYVAIRNQYKLCHKLALDNMIVFSKCSKLSNFSRFD